MEESADSLKGKNKEGPEAANICEVLVEKIKLTQLKKELKDKRLEIMRNKVDLVKASFKYEKRDKSNNNTDINHRKNVNSDEKKRNGIMSL